MADNDKKIWDDLGKRGSEFELPVEDFVWDNINTEIAAEKKSKKPVIWWKRFLPFLLLMIGVGAFGAFYVFSDGGNENRNWRPSSGFSDWIYSAHSPKDQPSQNMLEAGSLYSDSEKISGENTNAAVSDEVVIETSKTTKDVKNSSIGLSLIVHAEGLVKGIDAFHTIADNSNQPNSQGSEIQKSEEEPETIPHGEENEEYSNVSNVGYSDVIAAREEFEEQEEAAAVTEIEKDTIPFMEEEAVVMDQDTAETSTEAIAPPQTEEKVRIPNRIMGYAGIGRSFRTLNSNTHNELISHKNDHETFGTTFDFGVKMQFGLSQRFFLRTGLGYKFYSDQYDFQHDTISHTTRNDYQYVQLPVLVGWEFIQGKRSSLSLIAGMKANMLFSAQSSWVDPLVLAPVAHSNDDSNGPFRKMSFATSVSLDYTFSLTERLNIHLMPRSDIFLNSIYKRATDISQKPYSFNIDFGLSFDL